MTDDERFLRAYNTLSPKARKLYRDLGDALAVIPAHQSKLVERTNLPRSVVAQVLPFVEVWGGPGDRGLDEKLTADGEPAVHLIIPDAHFSRKDRMNNFARARRLGDYAALIAKKCATKNRRLRIVCLGDWWDMFSLCFYEKGKVGITQESVKEDLDTGYLALALFREALDRHQDVEPDSIDFHFLEGNHEERLVKARETAEYAPLLNHLPSHRTLAEGCGWKYHEYMVPANIDGVAYAHCFPSGVMGRAIGGTAAAKTLLDKMMVSCVAGHSHVYDMMLRTDAFGGKRFALVAGCYYDRIPSYAKATGPMWWRGVTILNGVRNGCLERGHAAVTVEDMIEAVGY